MLSFLRKIPFLNKLIAFDTRVGAVEARTYGIEERIAALDTHVARLNALIEENATTTTHKLDSLVARIHAVETQLEELSRNYTELTSGGLRDILEHWEQRVRDDFTTDRLQSMQELRSEISLLRSHPTGSAPERHEP
jgi:hypothetical protein